MVGVTEEGNAPYLKDKGGAGFLSIKLKSRPAFHFTIWDFRAIANVWDLNT